MKGSKIIVLSSITLIFIVIAFFLFRNNNKVSNNNKAKLNLSAFEKNNDTYTDTINDYIYELAKSNIPPNAYVGKSEEIEKLVGLYISKQFYDSIIDRRKDLKLRAKEIVANANYTAYISIYKSGSWEVPCRVPGAAARLAIQDCKFNQYRIDIVNTVHILEGNNRALPILNIEYNGKDKFLTVPDSKGNKNISFTYKSKEETGLKWGVHIFADEPYYDISFVYKQNNIDVQSIQTDSDPEGLFLKYLKDYLGDDVYELYFDNGP